MAPNILEGTTVRLTALTTDDLPAIALWQQDSDYLRLMSAVPAYPQPQNMLLNWLMERQADPTAFIFAIRAVGRNGLLGYVELHDIVWSNQVGTLGAGIGEPANRGKGYGFESLQLLLRFAFHEANLHRVQLQVLAYNAPAIALYERIGFQREGIYREYLQRDGKRHDLLLYGLLRPEWERHQEEQTKG